MQRSMILGLLSVGALALGGCDLELEDPNIPPADLALNTPEGIKSIAVGMQAEYSDQIVDPIYVVGLVTDEIGAGGATFDVYQRVDAGDPVDNNLDPAEAPWTGQYRVIKLADDLIEHAPQVELEAGTRSGILALASLYKAMALGNLSAIYESFPMEVGEERPNPAFVERDAALDAVVSLLQGARTLITETPPSAEFGADIIAPGLDLANTVDAMLARYALVAGQNDVALQAAQRVDLAVLSEFRFTATDRNPLYNLWYASGNAYQMRPEDVFRLEAETGDQRVGFWVAEDSIAGAVVALDHLSRFRDAADPISVYFPDEMRLIQAEVYARTDLLGSALDLVNDVRTQCSSALAEPVACLPALTLSDLPDREAMLDEILRQRRYELYLQGVRWDDLRRFGKTLKYEFMPWPQSECDRNSSAPC